MKALSSPTLQGMAWMLLASLAGTLIDTGVKALSSHYATPQIVLGRLVFGLPFVLLIAGFRGDLKNLKPKRWPGHGLRAVLSCGATFNASNRLSDSRILATGLHRVTSLYKFNNRLNYK